MSDDGLPHQTTVGQQWRTTLRRAGVPGVARPGTHEIDQTLITYARPWSSAEDPVPDATAHLIGEFDTSGERRPRAHNHSLIGANCVNSDVEAERLRRELGVSGDRWSSPENGA